MADFFGAISLTGGAAGALDAINGADLSDKDGAVVITPTEIYHYTLDADSGAAEDPPRVIAPDTNPGDKRWLLRRDSAGAVFDGSRGANQSIPQSTWTKITFTAENFDDDGVFNLADSKFIASTAGKYAFSFTASMETTTSVRVLMALYKNGVEIFRGADGASTSGGYWTESAFAILSLAQNDYIELYIYHAASAAKNCTYADLCGFKVSN